VADSDFGVAVYWDFENVHACLMDELKGKGAYRDSGFQQQEPLVGIDPVVEYAATFGRIVVHRAYCNWQYYARYRAELQAHAVELVQLFPLTGSKNGADIRLALDVAEDLQQHAHLTHVVIVSSDSDYTSLAQWCRRQGRLFIGVGTGKTAPSYTAACDEFRRYRDLAAASAAPAASALPAARALPAVGAVPAAAESAEAAQEPAPLEDAADLVVKAVRQLAAGRGDVWALKAAVRPLVKRLDPTFDERNFGFPTFAELLRALGADIVERKGENDHELGVRADVDGQAPPPGGVTVASFTPAALVERQLRRRKLRLPDERRAMWTVPELIVQAFGASSDAVEPSFESLRLKIESSAAEVGLELSEVDFNKVKWILWRGRVFEVYGPDKGIGLRVPNLEQLRYRLVSVLLENLDDAENEDAAVLAETFFGPDPTDEQHNLVRTALEALLDSRRNIQSARSEE
jgi:NYN domain-containing protein/OST-HTH/LOTUS domain-containing protein